MEIVLAVFALALCISGVICTGSGDLITALVGFGLMAVALAIAVGI